MTYQLSSVREAGRLLITAAVLSTPLLIGPAQLVAAQDRGETMEPAVVESSQGDIREVVAQESVVEWKRVLKHPRLDTTRLSEFQKRFVRRSPVPVLLPDRADLLETAAISTGGYFFAASMAEDDVSISVIGASKVILAPGVPEPPVLGDEELTVNRSEDGVGVSFKAYGVYYDLDVECVDPVNDPRCAEDACTLELAESLKMAVADTR